MRLQALIAAATLTLLAPSTAPAGRLVEAYLRVDRPELDRLGRALGAAGLAPDLASPDRATLLAAIAAAPSAEDSWALLEILAARAAEPDRSIAAPAAAAAATIATSIDRDLLLYREAPADQIRRGLLSWLRIAANDNRWADVRIHGLEVVAFLSAALGPHGPTLDWGALYDDVDPEFRRAALELTPRPLQGELRSDAAGLITSDVAADVAVVAAQVVCSDLAFAANPDVADGALGTVGALGEEGLARTRELVIDRSLPIAARVDAARCLVASGTKADRAAIRTLRNETPRHLRSRLSRSRR